MRRRKVFLSYCSVDHDLADILEQQIRDSEYKYVLEISRYTRDVEYKGSFIQFMDSIAEHDFVITIISDAYLKSPACMYEVSQLLLGNQNMDKFLYIVVDKNDENYYSQISTCNTKCADIYSEEGKVSYIKYWEDKTESAKRCLKELKEPYMHIEQAENVKRYNHILYYEIGPLMKYLNQHRSLSFLDIEKGGVKALLGNYIPLTDNENLPPISPEEKFEKALQDCMSPLILPESIVNERYYVGNLPVYFTISGDRIFFNNRWYEKRIQKLGVREEGPDAWGACVNLPMGVWFRRTHNFGDEVFGWYKTKGEDRVWIETVGYGIEVIEMTGEETIKWTAYIAYDLDSNC